MKREVETVLLILVAVVLLVLGALWARSSVIAHRAATPVEWPDLFRMYASDNCGAYVLVDGKLVPFDDAVAHSDRRGR